MWAHMTMSVFADRDTYTLFLTILSSAMGQKQEIALVQAKPFLHLRDEDVSTETTLDDSIGHDRGLVPQSLLDQT